MLVHRVLPSPLTGKCCVTVLTGAPALGHFTHKRHLHKAVGRLSARPALPKSYPQAGCHHAGLRKAAFSHSSSAHAFNCPLEHSCVSTTIYKLNTSKRKTTFITRLRKIIKCKQPRCLRKRTQLRSLRASYLSSLRERTANRRDL